MKRTVMGLMLLVLLVIGGSVGAQGDETISYGEIVTGEITNQSFEIPYLFSGNAGDLIVAEMQGVEALGDMDNPALLLVDGDYNLVASVNEFGKAVLAAVLPEDGEYFIIATRRNGRGGDSTGEFTLQLLSPPVLGSGDSYNGVASSEAIDYYVVEQPEFVVAFSRSGDFRPSVSVSYINEYELRPVATVEGDAVTEWSMRIEASEPGPYVVTIEEAIFDWNFNEVTCDYTLRLE